MERKIKELIQSCDYEMVELGILLIYNKGEKWIRDNIPAFGVPLRATPGIQINARVPSNKGLYIRGNIKCMITHGVLDMRYVGDFNSYETKWINI